MFALNKLKMLQKMIGNINNNKIVSCDGTNANSIDAVKWSTIDRFEQYLNSICLPFWIDTSRF